MGYNCQIGDCWTEGTARECPGSHTTITLCDKHWDEFLMVYLQDAEQKKPIIGRRPKRRVRNKLRKQVSKRVKERVLL